MSATEHTDGLPPNTRWIAMVAVSIAVSMSVLVGSIANVALPTIAHDMEVTPAESIRLNKLIARLPYTYGVGFDA